MQETQKTQVQEDTLEKGVATQSLYDLVRLQVYTI